MREEVVWICLLDDRRKSLYECHALRHIHHVSIPCEAANFDRTFVTNLTRGSRSPESPVVFPNFGQTAWLHVISVRRSLFAPSLLDAES
jgi:hypothetical protein